MPRGLETRLIRPIDWIVNNEEITGWTFRIVKNPDAVCFIVTSKLDIAMVAGRKTFLAGGRGTRSEIFER